MVHHLILVCPVHLVSGMWSFWSIFVSIIINIWSANWFLTCKEVFLTSGWLLTNVHKGDKNLSAPKCLRAVILQIGRYQSGFLISLLSHQLPSKRLAATCKGSTKWWDQTVKLVQVSRKHKKSNTIFLISTVSRKHNKSDTIFIFSGKH